MKKILSLLAVLLFSVGALQAKKNAPQDSIRVLFIGNSYTYYNKMPSMFDSIARTQKKRVAVTAVTKGGEKLAGHLKNPKLLDKLKKGGWDFVVIQEQSAMPSYSTPEVMRTTYKAAHTLDSLIRVGSPKAQTVYYMTWGHKFGCQKPQEGYPLINNYSGMQMRLANSYIEMAYDNNGRCAPVGLAWKEIREKHPDLVLYKQDCSHPSVLGSYLAANVIYSTIFPKPYQTVYTAGVPENVAEIIQQTAQNTVFDNLSILNIN